MKVEKINDNQVKFVLSQIDLDERNIRIAELAYGSEKTQALFREMMEQANVQYGFEADNVPLMIEAIPFSSDSITIIITKVSNVDDIENRFNLVQNSDSKLKESMKTKLDATFRKSKAADLIYIFSFNDLDDVTKLSTRLYGVFHGTNILYKNENRYFLLLQNDYFADGISGDDLNSILGEYGQKHVSTLMAKHYLTEHGEIIIKHPAIKVMAEYLR
ncbi:MAG: adaptor protein MecA [Clostridiales bacterium]|jgi:adapter protein MecA 1/2|nr:adaptor protein MecA [Clostridiales bacterium]